MLGMARFGIDAAAGDSIWSDACREGLDEFFAWQADPESPFRPPDCARCSIRCRRMVPVVA